MKSKLQEIFYFKELSYIGETIEGICHFSADYTDCGALLLDKIEFHDQCYRVENLNIFDKLMEFNQDQVHDYIYIIYTFYNTFFICRIKMKPKNMN